MTGGQTIQLQSHARPATPTHEVWAETVAVQPWPAHTTVAFERLAALSEFRRYGIIRAEWPWCRFIVQNGYALYRLGACDKGLFEATLVDSMYLGRGWVEHGKNLPGVKEP